MVTRKMSEMTIDASLDGTERLLAQGADGSIVLVSGIVSYTIDELVGADAATPATGDDIIAVRSGTEKVLDIDALSSYVVSSAWSVASAVTPAVSGDLLLVSRAGTVYDMDIDVLETYIKVDLQDDMLDLTGLDAATPGSSDLFLFGDGATPKKITRDNLETKLWADFKIYVEALSVVATAQSSDEYYVIQGGAAKVVEASDVAVYMDSAIIALGNVQDAATATIPAYLTALSAETSLANADEFLMQRSGTGYKVALSTLASYTADSSVEFPWTLIAATKYNDTPPSTSTLTMSDLSDIEIGDPIKFAIAGITYYAAVTAKNATTLTIAGASFGVTTISDLHVGDPRQLEVKTITVESLFGDAVYDMLSTLGRYERWDGPPAYLVAFTAAGGEADTGAAQPKVNVKIDSALVSSDDGAKGLQVSATPGTWTANTAVEITTGNYAITKGKSIEVSCTEAGTNGDAADLTINLLFVYE